jgi:hypothetical protein
MKKLILTSLLLAFCAVDWHGAFLGCFRDYAACQEAINGYPGLRCVYR